MRTTLILLGILFNLECVASSSGVIDIADPRALQHFSEPKKIGNALFYTHTSHGGGSPNFFDGESKIFPVRSHTRLVSLVLVSSGENFELIQVMYSDVKKDSRLNNLYYRKLDGVWHVVDQKRYRKELGKLKSNLLSFDLESRENRGFKKVKSREVDGYDSYQLEEDFELDKVRFGSKTLWQNEPHFTFKFLDLNHTPDGPDHMRFQYSNYYSVVEKYFKKSGGQWNFDFAKSVLDLTSLNTHGFKRNSSSTSGSNTDSNFTSDSNSSLLDEVEDGGEPAEFFGSDLTNEDNLLANFKFTFLLSKDRNKELTVQQYNSYNLDTFEFLNPVGAKLTSVSNGDLLFEEGESTFFNAKLSFVKDHHELLAAFTSLKKVEGACDERTGTCSKVPFTQDNYFHKTDGMEWTCLENSGYYAELNNLLEVASQLTMKKLYESPPETPSFTPSNAALDYRGMKTFTYDLNNPFEPKLDQEVLHSDPDLILLKPKKDFAVNVVVDGNTVLWEQRESGLGCLRLYIYRSDVRLMAHFVVDSATEPHVFFSFNGKKWLPTTRAEYDKQRVLAKFSFKSLLNWKSSPKFDEYSDTTTTTSTNSNSSTGSATKGTTTITTTVSSGPNAVVTEETTTTTNTNTTTNTTTTNTDSTGSTNKTGEKYADGDIIIVDDEVLDVSTAGAVAPDEDSGGEATDSHLNHNLEKTFVSTESSKH